MPIRPFGFVLSVDTFHVSIQPIFYFGIEIVFVGTDEITTAPLVGLDYEFARQFINWNFIGATVDSVQSIQQIRVACGVDNVFAAILSTKR